MGDVIARGLAKQNQEYLDDVTYNVSKKNPVGDGDADDTTALNSGLAECPAYGKYTFEKNKTYKITGQLTRTEPIEIDLNGSTLVLTGSNKTALSISQTKATYTGQTIAMDANTPSFTIPGGATVVKGDIVKLWSDTSYTTGVNYRRGYIGVVHSVVGSTAYLRSVPEFTFTANNLTVYKGIRGITVKNGTIDVSGCEFGNGLVVLGVNVKIENVTVVGADWCHQGMALTGENVRVEGCDISGFTNTNGQYGGGGRLGYGINAIGRNIILEGNNIINCKHCITTADRYSYTDSYIIKNNFIFQDVARANETIPYDGSDVFIAPMDIHANALHVVIENNKILACNGIMNIRSPRSIIKHNELRSLSTRTDRKAILFSEADIKKCLIEGNEVVINGSNGYFTYFLPSNETALIENVTIKGNKKCTNAQIYFNGGNTYRNIMVRDNDLFDCKGHGVYVGDGVIALDGLTVEDNYIEYNTGGAGNGVYTNVSNIGKPVVIKNNRFKNKGFSGASPQNVSINGTNKHIIDNNILDDAIIDNTSQFTYPWMGNMNIGGVNTLWKGCKVEGDLLTRGGSCPSSGTWGIGDYVKNSAPTVIGSSPNKYLVKGWTRVTAGSANALNTDWMEDRAAVGF